MRVWAATHNAHKMRELSVLFDGAEVLADNPEGVVEDAPDFAGNALLKVRAVAARHRGEWCIADDSGLEVAALGGEPGVRSARYAGERCDFAANNALLLERLAGVEDRRARFVCAMAIVDPDGREHVVEGVCGGRIAESPSGSAGFGYDPLFLPDGSDVTFAEMGDSEKNRVSHRARASAEARKVFEKWR